MRVVVEHSLSADQAVSRLKAGLQSAFADDVDSIKVTWNGRAADFSITASGSSISGTISVNDDEAVFEGKLPFFAGLFSGTIEEKIYSKVSQILC